MDIYIYIFTRRLEFYKMNTYYINEDYSEVKCLGCQETVIYPGRYIGNYCMSCHKNQKFRKQAFKDMIEGIKSNMIEFDIIDKDEYDVFSQSDGDYLYNYIKLPSLVSQKIGDFYYYIRNTIGEKIQKKYQMKNYYCGEKYHTKQTVLERKINTQEWIDNGIHLGYSKI